jgi:chorismate mutase
MHALRGATRLAEDDADEMRGAVMELVTAMLERNAITATDVVSVILTATPDLRSAFPAEGARACGLTEVPLLCAQEMDVVGAMPRVIRILMHVEKYVVSAHHVYLRGTETLRQDLHGDA